MEVPKKTECSERRWIGILIILLIAGIAMHGALRADFYMDDHMFIVNSQGTAPAEFRWHLFGMSFGTDTKSAHDITVFQTIPTLMTMLTNWLAPANAAVAHVWNLGIHLALSVLVFTAGRRMMEALHLLKSPELRTRAALLGSLIFACHPLGTEPVHYAKCHMVQLVALFAFWATCEAMIFIKSPSRAQATKTLLLAGLCMLSYFPGTVMLGINLMAILLWHLFGADGKRTRSQLKELWGSSQRKAKLWIFMGGVLIVSLASWYLNVYVNVLTNWDGMYAKHVVTQGRVFWEYFQRILIPIGLASDHYQPWSNFADKSAVLKLVALGLLSGCLAVTAFGKRSQAWRDWALLGLFALIPFLIRMLYVNIEIMVEYRAYHALPWVGLLVGTGLVVLAEMVPSAFSRLRWVPAGMLILLFTQMCIQRGRMWADESTLAAAVLEQYPMNNRARIHLQKEAYLKGDYRKALVLHEEINQTMEKLVAVNAAAGNGRKFDEMRADSTLFGSYQTATYSIAQLQGVSKGLEFAEASLNRLRMEKPDSFLIPAGGRSRAWPLLGARDAVRQAVDNQPSPN